MPIFMAFIVLAGFADNTLTGKTCLFVGLGLLAVVVVQTEMCIRDRARESAEKHHGNPDKEKDKEATPFR